MKLDNNTQALTESAIVTALMVVFALVGIYFLGIIIILYPIPFIVLGLRHGTRYNILSLIMSSLVVGILINIMLGIFLFIFFGFMSISLSYMIKRKYRHSHTLIFTTFILLLSTLIAIAMFNYIAGISFISELENFINQARNISYESITNMELSVYQLEQMKQMVKLMYELLILLIPFTIITTSLFIAYINFWLSIFILRRLGNKSTEVPKFKRLRLPSNIILGTLVLIGGALLIRYLEIFYYETLLINIIFLLILVFFLQGLAVLAFFIDKLRINKVFKIIIILLVMINLFLIIIIVLVGVLDTLFDFRKIRKVNIP